MSAPRQVVRLLDRGRVAGLFPGAVALWGSSEVTASSAVCGTTSLAPSGSRPDLHTAYDLASLTKPLVTGTLSVLAFRDGLLTPSTTLGEVFAGVTSPQLAQVTVSELLTHTSGLPAWTPLYGLARGDTKAVDRELLNLQLEAPPGTRVTYSCPGFILLGRMLERVMTLSLDRAFTDLVTEPLGISNELGFGPRAPGRDTAFGARAPVAETALLASRDEDPRFIPPVARGAPDDGNARFLGGVAGNAGLFGSALGVFRLALELLGGGGFLLAKEEILELSRPRTGTLNFHRAWAWQLASSPGCSAGPALSDSSFGHTGFTGTSLWIDRDLGQVFVLLTNRVHPAHRDTELHPLRRRFHVLAS